MGKRNGILMIATVGDDTEAVLVGVRDYPVQKLVLMHTRMFETAARETAEKVRAIFVETELREIKGDAVLMDTLRQVAEIQATEGLHFDDTVINVSSGDKMQTCSALSAAFVQGVPAIGVANGATFALPVLKFSYRELISEAKYRVLEALEAVGGHAESLHALAETSGVEKSLLSYHLRTTREGKGLEDMGLVEIERGTWGRLGITITEMGRLILLGRATKAQLA
jgi:DNA-binding transcriptional ArsR family regulator